MKHGRPTALTRRDIAFALELESEGVRKDFIARYVFGIDVIEYRRRLKERGVE